MSAPALQRPLPAWTPVPCPAWCQDRQDAAHAAKGCDHVRALGTVPASAGNLVEKDDSYDAGMVRVDVVREDGDHPAMVSATVHQPVPVVDADLTRRGISDERWAEAALTAPEARRVAALLAAAADLLDGVSGTAEGHRRAGTPAGDLRCLDCGGPWHDGDEVDQG